MHLAKEKSYADAEFYKLKLQAEANKLLLTKEFLEMKRIEAISANSKVYFGPSLPNTMWMPTPPIPSAENLTK